MIFTVWVMLVVALALFAWFSKTASGLVTAVFCVLSFPLLVGITKITTHTPECKLENKDYLVRGVKVTLDANNNPQRIYVFLDDTPPITCYFQYSDAAQEKINDANQKKNVGGELIISGGKDFDSRLPEEGEPKPNA